MQQHYNGLGQDCGISSADALEIPQSCTKSLNNSSSAELFKEK